MPAYPTTEVQWCEKSTHLTLLAPRGLPAESSFDNAMHVPVAADSEMEAISSTLLDSLCVEFGLHAT
jgi:hypothetical protein